MPKTRGTARQPHTETGHPPMADAPVAGRSAGPVRLRRRRLRWPLPMAWPALSEGQELPSPPLPGPLPGRLVIFRVAQFAIDITVVAAACYALLVIWIFVPRAPDGTFANPVVTLAAFLVNVAAVVAFNVWYWVVAPYRQGGQTWGMRLLGLRVIRPDGGAPTLCQLGLRLLLLAGDGLVFGLVGAAAMALTPSRQRLGDLLANTQVDRPGS